MKGKNGNREFRLVSHYPSIFLKIDMKFQCVFIN